MERANPLADLQVTVPHHGSPARGRIISVSPTDTSVALPDGDVMLANESIKAVRARSRFLGALEGLGLGVAAGAAGGGLATYAGCSAARDGCFEVEAGGAAVIGAVVFAAVGGIVGLIVGAARGDTTSYWFGSFAA